jgi:ApbE superfamily uncharacterized protein (UPF0280 family)
MREPLVVRMLSDGLRLHLHDGPIDLIVEVFGTPSARTAAYEAAAQRFGSVLEELCGELPVLRDAATKPINVNGVIAKRMADAVAPFSKRCFITPMAAVAGAVAEEILHAMTSRADLARAYVNNGGDIAVHLADGERFTIGMIDRPDRPSLFGSLQVDSSQLARGIATSGWRGRSFSLGIADAVTILARTASMADAAATIVANAVDLPGHVAIARAPAREIAPDSDLGGRLVTRGVGTLLPREIDTAIGSGIRVARELQIQGLLSAAAIHLQGQTQILDAFETTPSISMTTQTADARSAAHA